MLSLVSFSTFFFCVWCVWIRVFCPPTPGKKIWHKIFYISTPPPHILFFLMMGVSRNCPVPLTFAIGIIPMTLKAMWMCCLGAVILVKLVILVLWVMTSKFCHKFSAFLLITFWPWQQKFKTFLTNNNLVFFFVFFFKFWVWVV